MKKMIIFFAFMASFMITEAQTDLYLSITDPSGSWLEDYTGLDAYDTIGAGDSVWVSRTIYPNKGERLYYDIYLSVDSTGGTGDVANLCPFILQGRRLSVDSWTDIDTVNYAGTADTTFKYSQVSTAQFYTEYRISMTAANDDFAAKILRLIARFWY